MSWLDVFIVGGDDDALAGLGSNDTSRTNAPVDGAVISFQCSVFDASNSEASGLQVLWAVEASNKFGDLILGWSKAGGHSPQTPIKTSEGTSGDAPSPNKRAIDVRLPARHC